MMAPPPGLAAKLERAVTEGAGLTTVAHLVEEIRQGRMQFWQEGDTIAVTEILRYPLGDAVRYAVTAGNTREACRLLPTIEDWARERGAVRAEALGRKGWMPFARRYGYAPSAILFTKEL